MGARTQVILLYKQILTVLLSDETVKAFFLICVFDGGCSCKVVSAYLELSDPNVKEMVKSELQPLIDRGVLKRPGPNPDHKQAKKES